MNKHNKFINRYTLKMVERLKNGELRKVYKKQ